MHLLCLLKDNDEAIPLATAYIGEHVVGKSSYADCLHITPAIIYQADLPVSCNFKRIANVERIAGCTSIKLKSGYKQLNISFLRELM